MDAHERALTRQYNQAVAALRKTPRGDPRHMRAAGKVIYWRGALARYQRSRHN
jgi:hypothetical protein